MIYKVLFIVIINQQINYIIYLFKMVMIYLFHYCFIQEMH